LGLGRVSLVLTKRLKGTPVELLESTAKLRRLRRFVGRLRRRLLGYLCGLAIVSRAETLLLWVAAPAPARSGNRPFSERKSQGKPLSDFCRRSPATRAGAFAAPAVCTQTNSVYPVSRNLSGR
jgi:hypothetical protein